MQVRLILIDSVASPFRYGFHDMGLRNRILSGLSQNLIQLAVTSNIAVSIVTPSIMIAIVVFVIGGATIPK